MRCPDCGAELLVGMKEHGMDNCIMNLKDINAELLETLKLLLSHPSDDALDAIETDDGYFLSPLNIAEREARKLIRKAEEQMR